MCLEVTSEELTNKKPKKVYKALRYPSTSQFQLFRYEIGNTYRLRKKLKIRSNKISEGFHSYIGLKRALLGALHNVDRHVIGVFEIPRGAKYYLGEDDDIVSTSIKYLYNLKD